MSLIQLDAPVTLENGDCLGAGAQIADLHLWNEQVPLLTRDITAVAWGHRMSRGVAYSLRLLSQYLASRTDCDRVCAIRAGMALAPPEASAQLLRVCSRYGFIACRQGGEFTETAVRRYGENILISIMVLARNVRAFRFSSIRRSRVCVFLTRSELDKRFGKTGGPRISPARQS